MLLLRGATCTLLHMMHRWKVSIHAPLARSNRMNYKTRRRYAAVSIHAPLARSNSDGLALYVPLSVSIHAPLARSNSRKGQLQSHKRVSIHAPLARSNGNFLCNRFTIYVSIHAPLARSNFGTVSASGSGGGFNTCSSCEEQPVPVKLEASVTVSIHAPLARSNKQKRIC